MVRDLASCRDWRLVRVVLLAIFVRRLAFDLDFAFGPRAVVAEPTHRVSDRCDRPGADEIDNHLVHVGADAALFWLSGRRPLHPYAFLFEELHKGRVPGRLATVGNGPGHFDGHRRKGRTRGNA